MGRPPGEMLSTATAEEIAKLVRLGVYPETAAGSVGVAARTYFRWMAKGEAGEAAYIDFWQVIKKAECIAEKRLHLSVRKRPENWQAHSWIMERRWPARYGGRVRLTVSEEREAMLARLQKDPALLEKVRDVLDQAGPADAASQASAH